MATATDTACPRAAEDTLIVALARRLGEVRRRYDEMDHSQDRAVIDGALGVTDDAVESLKLLISTTPAQSLSDVAVQVAVAHAVVELTNHGADDMICDAAQTMVERLTASALLYLLDVEKVAVDQGALGRFVRLDHWRAVWVAVA